MLKLDHLAVAAQTLEDGQDWVEQVLGVRMQNGGKHAHYGTHNLLLGLEDGLYLEVIAVDPNAPALEYPRWFDLDRFTGRPRISNWICQTRSLDKALKVLSSAGAPVSLRRGDLRWKMAVPATGVLPYDNSFPALIEWQVEKHPAETLEASGCRLKRMTIAHPDADELGALLAPYMADDRIGFETGAVGMWAEFHTPNGPWVLS